MRTVRFCRLLFCTAALIFLSAASNIEKVNLNLKDNEVAFTFFDLRDGEASLIQNLSHNVLINTGSDESEYQLREQLAMYRVKKIDKLIITNAAKEYTGNIADVLEDYDVGKIISSKSIIEKLRVKYNLPKDKIKIWDRGKQENVLSGLKTHVLYESPDDLAAGGHNKDPKAGLVAHFAFGSQNVLYMGLAGSAVEKKVMNSPLINTQILKIGEFGINKGTTPSFLKKVDPQVAVLFHKKGLLPSDQMIERLQEIWIDIYQTHRNGSVTIKFNPHSYKIFTLPIEDEDGVFPG